MTATAAAVVVVLAALFPAVSTSMIGGVAKRTSTVLAVPALRPRRHS